MVRSTEGEGDRVGTLQLLAVWWPDHPPSTLTRLDLSRAKRGRGSNCHFTSNTRITTCAGVRSPTATNTLRASHSCGPGATSKLGVARK